MMMAFLVATMLNPNPVIISREPSPASPWTQSVQASCGKRVLLVEGYGVARPEDTKPRVLVNGRPVTGPAVEQLRDDLSNKSAAYRLEITCSDRGGIIVRINEGEIQRDGTVRYRASMAFIKGRRLVSYIGYQEGNADSFWFH